MKNDRTRLSRPGAAFGSPAEVSRETNAGSLRGNSRVWSTLSSLPVILGLLSGTVGKAQTVINFPNFSGNPSTIHWAGTTSVMQYAGPVLEMTQNGIHNATNAYFSTPVNVQAFTTTFTFSIGCPAAGTSCGDGLGFIWISTTNPSSPGFWSGWSGGQFSWSAGCTTPNTGSTNCVALNAALVKFDLYDVQKGAPGAELTGYYTGGEWPQPPNPEYDMSSAGINMQSGDLFRATLAYDGSNLTETLADTVTGATYSHTYTGVNIPGAVGGNEAIVGFGAGTGAATLQVNLDSWTYTVANPGAASAAAFSPAAGTYSGPQAVTITSPSSGAIVCYNTTGSPATNGAASCATGNLYTGPVAVSSSETLYAVAGGTGFTDSSVSSGAYVIQNSVATPVFSPAGGNYSSAQAVSITDSTANATIHYTTNGVQPTTSSPVYTGPITVSVTETLQAIAAAAGDSNSAVASAVYTVNPVATSVAAPTFSPAAGTFGGPQAVTISDATSGATIYYTTDGSTPTAASTTYTGPILVASTETVQAVAVASGNSPIATAAYVIAPQPQPNFTLATSSDSLTVASGSQATVTLTVTPENGFDAPVILACTSPSWATCSIGQTTVTPSGAAVTTKLMIAVNAQSSETRPGSRSFPIAAVAMAVGLFGWRKRRWSSLLAFLVMTAGLGLLFGCSGNTASSVGSNNSSNTPTTSAVTVTAISGSLQGSASISVTVQ